MAKGNVIVAAENTFEGNDYFLSVMKGDVPNQSIVNKFGRNGSVGTSLTHISIGNTYATPTTAQDLEIVSESASDNPGGTGGHKVIVEGLDFNFDPQFEEVILNGITPVALTKQFLRVFRGFISESGSYVTTTTPSHIGRITLRDLGGAGDDWFTISTVEETATGYGIGQTQIGTYTVPRGFTAYLLSKTFSVESNKTASLYFFKRENANDVTPPYTGIMRLFEQNDGIAQLSTIASKAPLQVIKEMSEVGFFAKVPSTTGSISVEFQLLLIKN